MTKMILAALMALAATPAMAEEHAAPMAGMGADVATDTKAEVTTTSTTVTTSATVATSETHVDGAAHGEHHE